MPHANKQIHIEVEQMLAVYRAQYGDEHAVVEHPPYAFQ
jgi:hypothetical protein